MAKPERWDLGKERFWRGVVEEWWRSGLGIREFCFRRRLKEPAFYWWRRALKERARQRTGSPAARATVTPPTAKPPTALPTAGKFVPVTVVEDNKPIEIVLSGGMIVRVPPGADEKSLQQVLGILGALPSENAADSEYADSAATEARRC